MVVFLSRAERWRGKCAISRAISFVGRLVRQPNVAGAAAAKLGRRHPAIGPAPAVAPALLSNCDRVFVLTDCPKGR